MDKDSFHLTSDCVARTVPGEAPEDRACTACNGSGEREVTDTTSGPDCDTHTINCPKCNGTGEPAAMARNEAYDKIDRYLRNNLDDADYAEYSAALEIVWRCPTEFALWVDRVDAARAALAKDAA